MLPGFLFLEAEKQHKRPHRASICRFWVWWTKKEEKHTPSSRLLWLWEEEKSSTLHRESGGDFVLVKLKKSGYDEERRKRRKEGFIYSPPSLLPSWSLARGSRIPWQRSQMFWNCGCINGLCTPISWPIPVPILVPHSSTWEVGEGPLGLRLPC